MLWTRGIKSFYCKSLAGSTNFAIDPFPQKASLEAAQATANPVVGLDLQLVSKTCFRGLRFPYTHLRILKPFLVGLQQASSGMWLKQRHPSHPEFRIKPKELNSNSLCYSQCVSLVVLQQSTTLVVLHLWHKFHNISSQCSWEGLIYYSC